MILAAALLTSAMLFVGTGCSDDDKNELKDILAPSNTWCTMPVTYKNSDSSSSANLYVSFYYTKTAQTGDSSTTGLRNGLTLPAGLTVLVTSKTDSSSVISGLTNTAYILKTFPKDSDTAGLDASDTSYSFTGSFAKWAAIYRLKSELRESANQTTAVPAALQGSSSYTELSWDNIKNQFSWKRLLANYLLQ